MITLCLVSASYSACDLSTTSSSDTDILPHNEETSREPWPSTFEVPCFSLDIEYTLRQGNIFYMIGGAHMSVSRDMKHNILQKLAEEMYKYFTLPQDEHLSVVAEMLIGKHPYLKEPGLTRACNRWKSCLKFKMGNLRAKLGRCGLADVLVNSNKKTQENSNGDPPAKDLKRPRRSETNSFQIFQRVT